MSTSYTSTNTDTFTMLHARQIASKVATDLKKFQRFYPGKGPTDEWIEKYEKELAVLIRYKALNSVTYGFKRNGKWTEASVRYTAMADGTLMANDDPGKIQPGLDVEGAVFTSFLDENRSHLSANDNAQMDKDLPFQRTNAETPPLEAGQWVNDLSYSAGGRGIGRATVKK